MSGKQHFKVNIRKTSADKVFIAIATVRQVERCALFHIRNQSALKLIPE
jgi:hypothetical protein